MRKHVILSVVLLAVLCPVVVFSAPAEVSARRAAGGMATEFKNYKLEASLKPILLPNKVPAESDRRIVEQAESMFDSNKSSLSIVMIEKGQLVFEKYRAPATPTSLNFSWSMSKSLTAYTVGALMCEGKIPDLNKPAQTYSNDLVGTVYGEATVKNLLTMSSGGLESQGSGNIIYKKPGTCDPAKDCDGWTLMRSGIMSNLDVIKHDPGRDTSWGRPVESGSRFSYSGNDTSSLANIAEHNGGFIESFDKYIWSNARTAGQGAWLLDKDGKAIAQAGFSASSRDWGRMAMFTIKQLKSEDKCISNFMKEATRPQIENKLKRIGNSFSHYGYQTWVRPEKWGTPASYWWLGYGGQRVAIDPVSERILVITSSREDYMDEIYKMFNTWQRQ